RVDSGTIYVKGNVECSGSTTLGSAVVIMDGTANANLIGSSPLRNCLALEIAKTAGAKVTMTSHFLMNSSNQDFIITSGTFDMAGFNLTVNRNITNNGTLRRGTNPTCGTLTYGGSYTGAAAVCP